MLKSGNRAGSRTPMQWDATAGAGFSTAAPDKFYLPLDPSPDRPNVATEEQDPDSQLHFVRRLLRLRKQYPALACRGEIEFFQKGNNAYPIVYERRKDNQHILVCINPSGKRVKTVRTCADGFKTISPILTKGKTQNIKSRKGHLYLDVPELSVGIYQVD